MESSTTVTTRMCREVMEDTIKGEGCVTSLGGGGVGCVTPLGRGKVERGDDGVQYHTLPRCSLSPVVVDRREDKNCDTGKFELAYKQVLRDS